MTAAAFPTSDSWWWNCPECKTAQPGFVDKEDATEAADAHNRRVHRGENPDDDYWDRLREDRRG